MEVSGGRGRYPYSRGDHLVAELWAYGDESGMHADPPFCLVAGFIAEPATWESFRTKWNEILAEYGVDGGFHAVEFFGGKRSYRQWHGDIRDRFIDKLAGVVAAHEMYPIGSAVEMSAFFQLSKIQREYFSGAQPAVVLSRIVRHKKLTIVGKADSATIETRGLSAPNQAYRVAAMRFLLQAYNLVPDDCAFHVVLGSHNSLASGLTRFFEEKLKERPDGDSHRRFESLTFRDAATTPELQASDLFVYLSNKRLQSTLGIREQRVFPLVDAHNTDPYAVGLQVTDNAVFQSEWAVFIKEMNDKLEQLGSRTRLS